jgi:[ribosomal protein S18]-alanine N-acetyltransferase
LEVAAEETIAQSDIGVRRMVVSDLETVAKIQRGSFADYEIWSVQAYVTELANPNAVYLVAVHRVPQGDPIVIGYAGIWVVMDEAHVTSIAVAPEWRGKRIGERLLIETLAAAYRLGARRATLEVRETNGPAHGLYEKYGFIFVAIRKKYYQDNGENADILWINDMTDPAWQELFTKNRVALGRA